MPALLADYDIGLILYKAHTKNYKYNAPNKLFEYLVCGLKVFYPDVMLGIKPYITENIIPLNFKNMTSIDTLVPNFKTSVASAIKLYC